MGSPLVRRLGVKAMYELETTGDYAIVIHMYHDDSSRVIHQSDALRRAALPPFRHSRPRGSVRRMRSASPARDARLARRAPPPSLRRLPSSAARADLARALLGARRRTAVLVRRRRARRGPPRRDARHRDPELGVRRTGSFARTARYGARDRAAPGNPHLRQADRQNARRYVAICRRRLTADRPIRDVDRPGG